MNKRFLIIATLLLLGGGLAVFLVFNHLNSEIETGAASDKQLTDFAAQHGVKLAPIPTAPAVVPVKPIPPSQVVRLAIGSLGLSDNGLNQEVGDLILTELGSVKNLALVDRQSLNTALRESEMSLSGLIRAQSAVQVGKLLRADWFLLGTAAAVNGTNYVVARIVDARSGVMRDAAVFNRENGPLLLAKDLAAFVRQVRDTATLPTPKTYLAIGGFGDLSLDNRQADFSNQLRAYLIAAYQKGEGVTVLEREFVDTLLQEMRLDLAGLTEEGATNAPSPMQSAFWLVDGFYQSYETSGAEVEVVLRVHRIFGHSSAATLKGPPKDSFLQNIKQVIDTVLGQANPFMLAPTKRSEIEAQLASGLALSQNALQSDLAWRKSSYYLNANPKELAILRRDLDEAMKAFQTVLLLDPENNEAKFHLAACLSLGIIDRQQEALNYYREVAEAKVPGNWPTRAMAELGRYYGFTVGDRAQAAMWYNRAADRSKGNESPNASGRLPSMIYSEFADQFLADTKVGSEVNLINGTLAMREDFKHQGRYNEGGYGIQAFMESFGTNRIDAARRLNELLPDLLKKFPELSPHLLAIALTYQVETNSPVVAEFMRSATQSAEHPELLLQPGEYFNRIGQSCYQWCMDNGMYDSAIRLIEIKHGSQMKNGHADPRYVFAYGGHPSSEAVAQLEADLNREDAMRMAYANLALQHWQQALDFFETLPPWPQQMRMKGPWDDPFYPNEMVAMCRQKLGLPVARDPSTLDLGEPCVRYPAVRAFIPDSNLVWIVSGNALWQSDVESLRFKEVKLPIEPDVCLSGLCDGSSKLWIGTCGAGLIEYDKESFKCRRLTVKDGLWSDDISSLYECGDKLWLAYRSQRGNPNEGEVGVLDLASRRAITFTPPLHLNSLDAAKPPDIQLATDPPRNTIEVMSGAGDDLLMLAGYQGLYWYHIQDHRWERPPWKPYHIAADLRRIVFGLGGTTLAVRNPGSTQFEKLDEVLGMPPTPVTALKLDNRDLWIGGPGYVGAIDLEKKAVRKLIRIHSGSVECIEVAAGYLWAQFNNCLYRVPLSETR